MKDVPAYLITVIIAAIMLICTIILALKAKGKRIYKYIPVMIVMGASFLFSAVMSMVKYGDYASIIYITVYLVVFPGAVVSLLTAGIFDLIDHYKK